MVRKPSKHQRSKQRCQDLGSRSMTVQNLLFCAHTMCMNYVTNTFLSARCNQHVPIGKMFQSHILIDTLYKQIKKRDTEREIRNELSFHREICEFIGSLVCQDCDFLFSCHPVEIYCSYLSLIEILLVLM